LRSPDPITRLNDSYTDDFTKKDSLGDDAYISFVGKATRLSGKHTKDPFAQHLVVAGIRDSKYLFTKVINVDEGGYFKIDSLFFYDSIGLQFQVNGEEDASAKDIKLHLTEFVPPPVDSSLFVRNWEDDELPIGAPDTTYSPTERNRYDLTKMKTLKPVIVKGWKNPRDQLDDLYTSGPFSEPALYSYDLRTDSGNVRNVFYYLSAQCGRLTYDPRNDMLGDVLGHPIHYFIDGWETSGATIRSLDFDRLAYIKVLESDFLSTMENQFTLSKGGRGPLGIPDQKTAINVCVYTRKGKDWRTMRGGMNTLTVKGYNDITPQKTDDVTLYWHPLESGHSFRISFSNSATAKRFRINVEAMTYKGQILHYETIVPN
jgi:hypothetical protein